MQLTRSQALDIIKDFQTELEQKPWFKSIKPYLKASLLYGSVAKGTNKPDSDIDMLLIVPLEVEQKYTAGEYSYDFKGTEINIVLRSIERLRSLAAGKPDAIQQEVFRDSVLIYEKNDEVRELLRKIAVRA